MKIGWYDQDLKKHCQINVTDDVYQKLTSYKEEEDKNRSTIDLFNDQERSARQFESFKQKVKELNVSITYS